MLLVQRALSIVKESLEVLNDVLEQVLNSNVYLYFIWYTIQACIVVIKKLISIIRLKEIEVTLNTLLQ